MGNGADTTGGFIAKSCKIAFVLAQIEVLQDGNTNNARIKRRPICQSRSDDEKRTDKPRPGHETVATISRYNSLQLDAV